MRIAGMWLLCMGCASPDTEEPGPELFGTPPAVPRGPGEFVALNADRAERTAVDLRARTVLWFYPNTAGDT